MVWDTGMDCWASCGCQGQGGRIKIIACGHPPIGWAARVGVGNPFCACGCTFCALGGRPAGTSGGCGTDGGDCTVEGGL